MNDDVASTSQEEPSGLEIKGPLVFYCANCRTIVGDTFSFVASNEERCTLTLSMSSNIKRSPDVFTSKNGSDVGSTYFNFTCVNCQKLLGRYYLTTSKDLDEVREKFTFDVKALTSYELGKGQNGTISEHVAGDDEVVKNMNSDRADSNGISQSLQDIKETIIGQGEKIGNLDNELLKVQEVALSMLERIEALEAGKGQRTSGNSIRADQWMQVGLQPRGYGSPDKAAKRLKRGD